MYDLYKKYLPYLQELQDVRVAGLALFALAAVLVSYSSVKTIDTNYKLQKQIVALQQENEVQALRNENLKLTNDYYNTDQYLELAARQNFGLAKPGETELIVPSTVSAKYVKPAKPLETTQTQAQASLPSWQKNFQDWVDFFLHRQ